MIGAASQIEKPKLRRPAVRYHGSKWMLAPWIGRSEHPKKERVQAVGESETARALE